MAVYRNTNKIIQAQEFILTDTVWDDLRFPSTAINPPGLVSDPTFDTTDIGWLFAPDATNILFFVAQVPHKYKEGTSLHCHVHWEPTNTNTGNVLWRLSYRWRNDRETAGAFTDVSVLATANGTASKVQFDDFPEISKTNALVSSILDLKVERIGGDLSDTYNANARLKEFDIHFEIDTIGSREEVTK